MRQARLGYELSVSERLFSRVFGYQSLTVNFVILICSICLMCSPHFFMGLHRFSAWLEHQMMTGHLGHLPGFLIFTAIAATVLFVQEIEKRRRRQP